MKPIFNLKWKTKFVIAIILDAIDLVMGLGGLALNLIIPGIAVIINNIRGVFYDSVTTLVITLLFGGKGIIYGLEILVPDEIDMFIPTATIVALMNRRKK